jgi:hypothetical protein
VDKFDAKKLAAKLDEAPPNWTVDGGRLAEVCEIDSAVSYSLATTSGRNDC